ncbi:uncharacterized protein LOC100180559 isoform X2 [Ciona intestinalis]
MKKPQYIIAVLILLASVPSEQAAVKSRATRSNGYAYGSYSSSLYSLHRPSYGVYSQRNSARSSIHTPRGAERNVYSGRFCSYPSVKLVPQRFKNGTQTYLKRVVSQCPWSSLYCNPKVSYVVASRYTYSIRLQRVTTDEWRCCPGFSGDNCENACYNCSSLSNLQEQIDLLSQQVSGNLEAGNSLPSSGVVSRGPEGPVGPRGPRGRIGLPGASGTPGRKGEQGLPGRNGADGRHGRHGSKGETGAEGPQGEIGLPGVPGPRGETGAAGTKGERGNTGEKGVAGETGNTGPQGIQGPAGISGTAGTSGAVGPQGPPGPPGVCTCGPNNIITQPPPTEPISAAYPRKVEGVQIIEELTANHQSGKPTASWTGPLLVDFCASQLWRRRVTELSCDFDKENTLSLPGRRFRRGEGLEGGNGPGRKGGTFCLFESSPRPPGGEWTLENAMDFLREDNWSTTSPEDSADIPQENEGPILPQAPLNGESLPDDFFLIYRRPTSHNPRNHHANIAQLASPFFSNELHGICMTFRYLVRGHSLSDAGLLVYLLPCNPAYKFPVLNLTATPNNLTNVWLRAVVPLPDYKRPYRVILEARPGSGGLELLAVDDVIFSECGSNSCMYQGQQRSNNELWKSEDCQECLCQDGVVTCFEILCPTIACRFTYKPVGYCCRVCCPNQEVDFVTESSGDEYTDGSDDNTEYNTSEIDENELYSTYPTYEMDTPAPTTEMRTDILGCPIAPQPRTSTNIDAVCKLRKDTGPCRGRFTKFYFDKRTRSCRQFTYGGCEGNANNFDSPDDCRRLCVDAANPNRSPPRNTNSNLPSRCYHPVMAGDCRGSNPRFYYDSGTGMCHLFTYGGCGGNENRFFDPTECKRVCGGKPVYPGLGTKAPPPESLVSIDDDIRPRQSGRCREEKLVGPCKARMPRFYFDTDTGRCRLFTYGGCKGNENRFLTPWACRDTCGGAEPVYTEEAPDPSAACHLPKVRGPCKGSIPRFYYNPTTNRCQIFVYGGCAGNENNFETPRQCQSLCGGDVSFEYERNTGETARTRSNTLTSSETPMVPAEFCTTPMEEGPCRASLYRYHFNSETQLCSVFVYGGCRGNQNNFMAPEECQAACGGEGFNFTVTTSQQNQVQSITAQREIIAGPPGPPGERGPEGPAGSPGTPGVIPKAATRTAALAIAEDVTEMKATIERLSSRILVLEQELLNGILSVVEGDNIENVVVPDVFNPEIQPAEPTPPLLNHRNSPVGRGDNTDFETTERGRGEK